jgi:hypothetical protein
MSVTSISKPHESWRCSESLAVQATGVVPTGNFDPLAGTHVIVTGASPPTDVACSNVTASSPPSGDSCEMDAGQVILGGSVAGGCGVTGFLSSVQAVRVSAHRSATASREGDLAGFTFQGGG